jgi:rhamnosyltransferase
LGGLEEEFFIDHIDTEWSFRILAAGFTLWGIPNAVFTHFMGDRGVRFWWFGWRVWPMRSPIRHFYLFRNAVRLMRRRYVFAVWKFWNVVKLSLTAMVHMTLDDQRGAQLKSMWRGVKAGFARKPR